MIAPVDPYIDAFASAGADRITAHLEAGPHIHRTLQAIAAAGCRAGVAINPGTPVAALGPVLGLVDLVCVMSVNPGFGGQAFIPETIMRVREIRAMIARRDIRIEIDGGVSPSNAGDLADAGADILVAGSSTFRGGSAEAPEAYGTNMKAIRDACGTWA